MSTTRIINQINQYHSENQTTSLARVEPTQALLLAPMPCEKRTALIRNKTVASLEAHDIGEVAFRYLQNKEGEINTQSEVIVWGIFTALSFALLTGAKTLDANIFIQGILLLCAAGCTAHVLPNINNSNRYHETKLACHEWLQNQLGQQKLHRIENLPYNTSGMNKLTRFLQGENINTDSIEEKLQTPRHFY
jgi:hypothetical protein